MKALTKLLAILAVLAAPVVASETVSIGHTFSLASEVLGHERRVHIHLPEGYAKDTKQRYPVINSVGETRGFKAHAGLLDSFSHYRPIMPPVIYVVLASVPEDGDQIPVYEMTPKTKADRILDGGHLTAMFGLYTLMTRTELFQAYIATTPYLFRDDSVLIQMASDFFDKERDLSAFLYLSINDERLRPYYDRFINILEQQAPPTLDWHSVEYPVRVESHRGLLLRHCAQVHNWDGRLCPLSPKTAGGGLNDYQCDRISHLYFRVRGTCLRTQEPV